MAQQPILSIIAIALFVIGIAGNGFEMRKIHMSARDEDITSRKAFFSKRNFKWYALIVIALGLWALSNSY